MKASKEKYIEEVKTVMHRQLSMHFITDIDEELAPMLEDIDLDFEDYYEARRKGNIIRIDDHLVMWLNGITCAWVLLNYPEKPLPVLIYLQEKKSYLTLKKFITLAG